MSRSKKKRKKIARHRNNPAIDRALAPAPHTQSPQQQQAIHQQSLTFHRGPLPAPEDLAKYNTIVPGAAERILSMAENQSEHRQKLEMIAIKSDASNSKRGQWFGFLLSLLVIIGGGALVIAGYDITGLILILGDLAILAGVFVTGTLTRKKERIQKYRQSNQ